MTNDESTLLNHINGYLAQGRVLHLATVSNGQPWVCHVWYASVPAENSLVFTSNRSRRHSVELAAQPRVAGGVVAIPLEGLGQRIRGLSFEGRATEAVGDALVGAYEAYAQRWPQVRGMFSAKDMEVGATQMRMYILKMDRVVLFDEVNYPANPRQELLLSA